jgi:hypothetical protein
VLSGQGATLFTAINAMIGLLCSVQLWLVSASLEALYSNDYLTPQIAFLASLVLLLVNVALYRHAKAFDKRRNEEQRRLAAGRRIPEVGAS